MVDHICATYGFLKHFDTKIIYTYLHICIYTYLPKTKKFGCVGRGDLTSLFFSKVAKWIEVRGDLCSNVENKKSFTNRPSDRKKLCLIISLA